MAKKSAGHFGFCETRVVEIKKGREGMVKPSVSCLMVKPTSEEVAVEVDAAEADREMEGADDGVLKEIGPENSRPESLS